MKAILAFAAVLASIAGCNSSNNPTFVPYLLRTGGDATRGRDVIQQDGCGGCHTIPGVRGAKGLVGPPLMWWSRRTFIAGELPNTPENLVNWIRNPQAIEPHTAMPALGVTDQQARDVAAYLYTLR